jgi:hypothetical protein
MHQLSNKTILLISPQAWGSMALSKHHYAVELAKKGNQVFFLNPPDCTLSRPGIYTEKSSVHPNLFFIRTRLNFPYRLRFHARLLFQFFMKRFIKSINDTIGKPIDIVWSFDIGNIYPISFFKSKLKIFHPVDRPHNKDAILAAKGSDFIFSVTKEILNEYIHFPASRHLINHGVTEEFLIENKNNEVAANLITVGLSGNFTRNDIDRETLLKIIKDNPTIVFECWGSYDIKQANLGGSDDEEQLKFVSNLKSSSNVILHGPVPSTTLSKEFKRVHAFLICYDIRKDHSQGTNYHKVMEYLSTGKVIISNNMTAYDNESGLIVMTKKRTDNSELPALFRQVINNLQFYNSKAEQSKRISFASENTYTRQVELIQGIVANKLSNG